MLFNNNYKLMHKNTYGGLTVVTFEDDNQLNTIIAKFEKFLKEIGFNLNNRKLVLVSAKEETGK